MRILTLALVAVLAAAASAEKGERAFLGVGGQSAEGEIKGFVLTQVHEGTAAHKAGFREGDILVEFDGKKVTGFDSMHDAVTARRPGDRVGYKLRRGTGAVDGFVILGRIADERIQTERIEILELDKLIPVPAGPDAEIDHRIAELERTLREIQREIAERLLHETEKLRKQLAERPARFHFRDALPVRPQAAHKGPAGVRRGPPQRIEALEKRMDRIEAKVDRILKILEARPAPVEK